jgi:hypothetical protein
MGGRPWPTGEGSKRPGDLGMLRHKLMEIIRPAGLRDGLDRQGPWQAPRLDPSAFWGWRFAVQDDGGQPARSVDTLRGYVRDADAFRDHAGAGLL